MVVKKYATTDYYPQTHYVRGFIIRIVRCWYCQKWFKLVDGDRLEWHPCHGGSRLYWNMFGTPVRPQPEK